LGTVGFFGEPTVWLGYLTVTVGAIGWFVVGLFLGTWRRIVPLLIVGVAFAIQQSLISKPPPLGGTSAIDSSSEKKSFG
jgi:hypothetical protein